MPTWTKEMALEIIAAGYKSMARKYHPDVGGTHEQMLDLTATREQLETLARGGRSTSGYSWERQRAQEREERARRDEQQRARDRARWKSQSTSSDENIPIEPYPHDNDYFQIADVTIMAITEKAFKIKIPKVKNPQWLPKSQLHEDVDIDAINEGDVITIVFSRWIAQQKGWLK